jgi:hypothetical protein
MILGLERDSLRVKLVRDRIPEGPWNPEQRKYSHTEQCFWIQLHTVSANPVAGWYRPYVTIKKSGEKFHINYRCAYLARKKNSLFFIFIALTETGVVAPDLDWIQMQTGSGSDPGRQK